MSHVTQTMLVLRINHAIDRIETVLKSPRSADMPEKLAACETKYDALRAETNAAVSALDALILQTGAAAH